MPQFLPVVGPVAVEGDGVLEDDPGDEFLAPEVELDDDRSGRPERVPGEEVRVGRAQVRQHAADAPPVDGLQLGLVGDDWQAVAVTCWKNSTYLHQIHIRLDDALESPKNYIEKRKFDSK